MNIVHIYPNIFRMHGATKVLLLFTTKLSEAGENNTIICGSFKIPVPYWFKGKIHPVFQSSRKKKEFRGSRKLFAIFGELILAIFLPLFIPEKTDMIVFHAENSILSIPLAKLLHRKAKLVYYCYQPPRELYDLAETSQKTYGFWFTILKPFIPLYKYAQTILIKMVKYVLTWSDYTRDYVESIYGTLNFRIVPAGVDLSVFDLDQDARDRICFLQNKLDLHNKYVLLTNSSLTNKKNIPTLLRLTKTLKGEGYPVHCLIIGEGPEEKALKNLAEQLGIAPNVTFLGFVSQEDLPLYYFICDIMYYLELRGLWTMSTIEAGAAKKPVIVAPGGSMPTLVSHGKTGFILSDIEDTKEVLKYTTLLLDSKEKRKEMGKRNYIHSRQFDAARIAEDFIAMFKQN